MVNVRYWNDSLLHVHRSGVGYCQVNPDPQPRADNMPRTIRYTLGISLTTTDKERTWLEERKSLRFYRPCPSHLGLEPRTVVFQSYNVSRSSLLILPLFQPLIQYGRGSPMPRTL